MTYSREDWYSDLYKYVRDNGFLEEPSDSIPDTSSGRASTKAVETSRWKLVAAEEIYGGCLCDHTPTEAEIEACAALKCAQEGCEKGWFHLECVGLTRVEKGWMCETDLRRKRRG